ncbi:MAG: hypothetical protein VKN33_02115 [Candidatus Sericytochromatia bacterium]|nr:hypothetical protein [Candidatus Sericytochromatia bacterium]
MTPERHPLLGLRAAEQRVLLRHLVGREVEMRAIAGRALRNQWLSLSIWTLCLLASLSFTAFFLGYGTRTSVAASAAITVVVLLLQTLIAAFLRKGWRSAPAALLNFLVSPSLPWRALRGGLHPADMPASHLVLVAGLLLSCRPSISSTLVERLVGRMAGVTAVQEALDWLVRAGYLLPTFSSPSVLALSLKGRRLLQAMNVPLEITNSPIEMAIPVHLLPLLESPETFAEKNKDDQGSRPSVSVFEEPTPSLALTEIPSIRRGSSRLWIWLAVLIAAVVGGVLAVWTSGVLQGSGHRVDVQRHLVVTESHRLPHSRGRVLQMNPDGLLLSSFAGHLYLSVPERLDHKEPWDFSGYDMAAECALVGRPIRRAMLAPLGRFLWIEAEPVAGLSGAERCLIDVETRTVHHNWGTVPKDSHVAGWLDAQTLLLCSGGQPVSSSSEWKVCNVLNPRPQTIGVPLNPRIVPLESQDGLTNFAALHNDPKQGWNLTLLRWNSKGAFQPDPRPPVPLPFIEPNFRPVRGAISSDRQLVVMTWENILGGSGRRSLLSLIPLVNHPAMPLAMAAQLSSEAPVFWGNDGREGYYRCFYHTRGEHGFEPWSLDIVLHPDASGKQGAPGNGFSLTADSTGPTTPRPTPR